MILLSKNAKNAPTIYFKFGKVKTPSYLCKNTGKWQTHLLYSSNSNFTSA